LYTGGADYAILKKIKKQLDSFSRMVYWMEIKRVLYAGKLLTVFKQYVVFSFL
jgi:hypothetical protein